MLFRKIADFIEDHLKNDSKKILLIDGARQIGEGLYYPSGARSIPRQSILSS